MTFEEVLNLITINNKLRSGYKNIILCNEGLKNEIFSKTEFTDNLEEKVYCYINKITEPKICKRCNNKVNFRSFSKGYYTWCGYKCSSNSDEYKEKSKATTLLKYGVENLFCSDVFKSKTKATNLIRYGNENACKSDLIKDKIRKATNKNMSERKSEIMEKTKSTNINKYGTEYSSQNETVKNKKHNTNIERYGVKHVLQCPDVIAKTKQTCLDRYGVTHLSKLESTQNKIKASNLIKFGKEHVMQVPEIKERMLRSKNKNLNKKGRVNVSQLKLSLDCIKKMNDKYWLSYQHKTLKKTCVQISSELNVAHSTICHRLKSHNIIVSRFAKTFWEKQLRETLGEIDVIENTRNIISPYELDFYFPKHNFAIELNGLYWHSFDRKETVSERQKHLTKTKMCAEKGVHLFQIFENEWINNTKRQIWLSMINSKLNKNNRIFARKCEIKAIHKNEAKTFIDSSHLQGYIPAEINIGLLYENNIVSIMSLGKPRYNKNYQYEILRFCNTLNTSVIGAASKLFTFFIKNYSPTSIISYADLRYSIGNMYDKIGMKYLRNTECNFYYFSKDKILQSRIKYQKYKLHSLLENFDASLTADQNMFNHGYRRIWDCGNMVFEWKPSQSQ